MEHAHQQSSQDQDQVKRSNGHEGSRNQLVAFAISIVLTILAFVAVSMKGVSKEFVVTFIVIMAVVQVIVQLAFWMHLKDRGHFWPVMAMAMGVFVLFLALASTTYWLWYQ